MAQRPYPNGERRRPVDSKWAREGPAGETHAHDSLYADGREVERNLVTDAHLRAGAGANPSKYGRIHRLERTFTALKSDPAGPSLRTVSSTTTW